MNRCGNPKAYSELVKAVTESDDGKPVLLHEWEQKVRAGNDNIELPSPWNEPFTIEWLKLPPQLGGCDLRGALYVSREHTPLITPEDRLSPEAAELLEGFLEHPDMASSMKVKLDALPRPEISVIMDRLLARARQEQEWGTPEILDACITVAQVDSTQGQRLAGFLKERPRAQIKPSIVPKIGDELWVGNVFNSWSKDGDVSEPVKRAINIKRKKSGNITI